MTISGQEPAVDPVVEGSHAADRALEQAALVARHRFLLAMAALLALMLGIVYLADGASSTLTYLVLLPVVGVAARFGALAGMAAAAIAGLLLGPFMPWVVSAESSQPLAIWSTRLLVFVLVAAFVGSLAQRSRVVASARIEVAKTDPGTRMPNQSALREDLYKRLEARQGHDTNLSVLLVRALDIGEIYDLVGSHGGDVLMRTLGERLAGLHPELQGPYRFSTSEVAFFLPTPQQSDREGIAEALWSAAALPTSIDGVPLRVEPAIGIGHRHYPSPRDTNELIRRSRVALRHAITQQARWVHYDEKFSQDYRGSISLIASIHEALENQEFELHYQPKIDLQQQCISGTEALLRWQHKGEMIPPSRFIPKLERTSLIDAVTRFVVNQTTSFDAETMRWPVAINLSARNLLNETLVREIAHQLATSGFGPDQIEFEITESALMQEPRAALRLIHHLRGLGFGIAIDDFGTGYSSFSYLKNIPATNLKIDGSFIHDLEQDARTRKLVNAIIEIGHGLGMTVTAEQVETQPQADLLKGFGCDHAQGFLWTPALPEGEFRTWAAAFH